jgi:hypothetical protein
MENGKCRWQPRRLHGRSRAHAMTLGVWALRPLRALCEIIRNALCEPMRISLYETSVPTNYKFGLTLTIRCGNMGGARCVRHRLLSVT